MAMVFARKLLHLLVVIKDALALLLLLLFFLALYGVLMARPSPGQVRDGALLLKLNGSVVEEPEEADPFAALLSGDMPVRQYRARDVVQALDAAAKDDKVKAVALDLSRFSGGGLVHIEEIGAALDRVRAAKKPVLTWSLGYADDGLMLAAHSSEVWIDPMGGAFVMGPGGANVYFAKLLERFKITPHVYRVGTYKEFVEPYLRNDMSEPAREARKAVTGALFESWIADVKKARPQANLALVTTDPAGWYKAAGGDGAKAAKSAGLVDRIGDRIAFGQRVAVFAGEDALDPRPGSFAHSTFKAYLAAHEPATPGKAIGVVTIAGEIVDGKAGPGKAGGDRIADLLDGKETKDIKALVVRIDSPGGSVTASERIRTAIERQQARGIPVVVSMANVAASGGYWVSTPASKVFAEPGTITGSIGIFAIINSFEKALAEYGVTSDGVRTTPLSGQPDVIGGLTPQVESLLQSTIENGYQRFIGLVAKARGKTPDQVDQIAQGRIWDGGTARQIGLVDQYGSLDDALAYAAKQAGLEQGKWHAAYLGETQNPYQSLLERIASDEDSSPPDEGDLFAMLATRQQASLAHALGQAKHILGVRGMQAYCLECPAPEVRQQRSVPSSGLLAWLSALGLGV
jgi:protease-4